MALWRTWTLIEYVLLGDPSIQPITYSLTKPGPEIDLAAEELRQRRVARAQMARQIRKLLPKRSRATPKEQHKAKTLFTVAQGKIVKEASSVLKQFAIRPTPIRVQKLHTPLRAPRDAREGANQEPAITANIIGVDGASRRRAESDSVC
jgi:hypothetical protein